MEIMESLWRTDLESNGTFEEVKEVLVFPGIPGPRLFLHVLLSCFFLNRGNMYLLTSLLRFFADVGDESEATSRDRRCTERASPTFCGPGISNQNNVGFWNNGPNAPWGSM